MIFLSIEDAHIGTEAAEIAKLDLIQIRLAAAPSEHDFGADRQQVVVLVDHHIVVVHAYESRMDGAPFRHIVRHLRDAANPVGDAVDEDLAMVTERHDLIRARPEIEGGVFAGHAIVE